VNAAIDLQGARRRGGEVHDLHGLPHGVLNLDQALAAERKFMKFTVCDIAS